MHRYNFPFSYKLGASFGPEIAIGAVMKKPKTMKRRLRKKKHVGEFQEFGFHVGFEFEADLTDEQRNALLDRFLREAIEANGLQFGGGGSANAWTGFAARNGTGSATEHHRRAVEAWMGEQDPIKFVYIGPLIDAWYGDFDGPLRAGGEKKFPTWPL